LRSESTPHVVRRVRPEDWPALRDLRLEMLADTPIAYIETVEQAKQRSDAEWIARASTGSVSHRMATRVVDHGGDIVGTLIGLADEKRTWIVSVYLDPAYRGQGLIEWLVDEAAAWSIEHGRPTLVLEVARENAPAVSAYRRLGFTPTGASQPHPLYDGYTEIEMSRPARWLS
jgi:ribosomal protein S18 acetylase RimI-like enzyme